MMTTTTTTTTTTTKTTTTNNEEVYDDDVATGRYVKNYAIKVMTQENRWGYGRMGVRVGWG